MSQDSRRLRSEYLKNGCKECKRRKIKCDEFRSPPAEAVRVINAQGRDLCWQCTRLKKECEYPLKGEKVARVLLKVLKEERERERDEKRRRDALRRSLLNPDMYGVHMSAPLVAAQGTVHSDSSVSTLATVLSRHRGHSALPAHTGVSGQAVVGHSSVSSLTNHSAPSNGPITGHSSSLSTVPTNGPGHFSGPVLSNSGSALSTGYLAHSTGQSVHSAPSSASATTPVTSAPSGVSPLGVSPGLGVSPAMSPGISGPYLPYTENGPSTVEYLPHPLYGQFQQQPRYISALPSSGHVSSLNIPPDPHFYDHADLTGLATDLNNLVSDMMYEANPDSKVLKSDTNLTPLTPKSEETSSSVDSSKARISQNDWIPRNVGLGYLDVRRPEERQFLQEFYLEFANIILPFNAYDRPLQAYFNPVRDILLKCASKEPFLLAAIMAQGARSSLAKSSNADEEEAYYQYLLRCLKLLGPALGHASSKNGLALTSNIEAVLLTVLLLTSSNAANAKQNWRPHLKGAKDLLLKHTTNRSNVRNSKVLIFCKYWFMSFEILAGLGLTRGGTIHLEAELDLLLNLQDQFELQTLIDLGIVLPNGFNLIVGFHCELIHPLRDLVKLLNKVRQNKFYVRLETSEYVRLLAEFHRQLNVTFINKKAIFDINELPEKVIPDGHLLEAVTVDSKPFVISWMDTSQQLYCLAATLTLLTEFLQLPYSSPQVQELTYRMTMLLSCIIPRVNSPLFIKYSTLMIQWPLLVAGLNCVRDSDQYLVTEFFNSTTKLGAGSAGHSMNQLRRVWRKHHSGSMDDSGDESPVDVVNY